MSKSKERIDSLTRQPRNSAPQIFLDLFAGCGGLSLGLLTAGWTGLFAVEKDALAFETLKHNLINSDRPVRYEWPDWLPQQPFTTAKLIKSYGESLAQLKGKITLIAGGPPCQGFSMAGRRRKNDPRNGLFREYIKVVEAIEPNLLLLENVRGIDIAFGKKKKGAYKSRGAGRPPAPFSQKIKAKLEHIGYTVFSKLVNASDFGVAQRRPRYLIVAVRRELLVGREQFDPFERLESIRYKFLRTRQLPTDRPISVKEALSDLEVTGKTLMTSPDSPGFQQIVYGGPMTSYQRLLHGSLNGSAPNSMRLAKHRDAIRERFASILATCRRGVQLSKHDRERFGMSKHCTVPLEPSMPSHTLTTLPDDILHYSEPRILSVREYARLQSFPDWYALKGKYTTGGHRRTRECPRYTQVGNAVPPLLAEALGEMLAEVAAMLS